MGCPLRDRLVDNRQADSPRYPPSPHGICLRPDALRLPQERYKKGLAGLEANRANNDAILMELWVAPPHILSAAGTR